MPDKKISPSERVVAKEFLYKFRVDEIKKKSVPKKKP